MARPDEGVIVETLVWRLESHELSGRGWRTGLVGAWERPPVEEVRGGMAFGEVRWAEDILGEVEAPSVCDMELARRGGDGGSGFGRPKVCLVRDASVVSDCFDALRLFIRVSRAAE